MNNVKKLVAMFLFLVSLNMILALDFIVTSNPVKDTILNHADQPAVFEFKIINNDNYDEFEIYTFERFKLSQEEFSLEPGESKTLRIEFLPYGSMRENEGHTPVPVYFLNKNGKDPFVHEISIDLVELQNAFSFTSDDISSDQTVLKVVVFNKEDLEYSDVEMRFNSVFTEEYVLYDSFAPFERKEIEIPVDNNKLRKLVFGDYDLNVEISAKNKVVNVKGTVNIIEKSGIESSEDVSGFIINKNFLSKTNVGNVPAVGEIVLKKNIISRLFTTYSIEADSVERDGFYVYYYWRDEIQPDESFSVTATTNWFYPLIVVLLICIIVYLISAYSSRHLVIKKNVSFVKTKSNDFALKVSLRVKANKFMEKVQVYDALPGMAQLYDKYGNSPTHFDKNSRRLRWDFKHLAEGEERVLEYIFYSKMKVIGKFELPSAIGIYEIQGKMHEVQSNRAFFINETEPQKQKFGKLE